MKWVVRQSNKLAIGFVVLFIIITSVNVLVGSSARDMSGYFRSMYADRLVPAVEISNVLEKLYQNRLAIEDQLLYNSGKPSIIDLEVRIKANADEVDALLHSFERTYLVESEATDLKLFYAALKTHRANQQSVIELAKNDQFSEAKALLSGPYQRSFKETITEAHKLLAIQQLVGENLYKEAESEAAGMRILSNLETVLGVAVALIVLILFKAQAFRPKLNQQHHLN